MTRRLSPPASTAAPASARGRPCGGFTLIELLVVLAIIALLLTLSLPRYFQSIDIAKETVLKENLRLTRKSIDQFYGDTGHYPNDLAELVVRKYLHAAPIDPETDSSATWVLIEPDDTSTGKLYDLHSGAPGLTHDGVQFGAL